MELSQRHRWVQKFRREILALGGEWHECVWQRPTGTTMGLVMGSPARVSSPLLLFLHGVGNDCLFPNAGLFRTLVAAGYTVATADLDGHGKSNTTTFNVRDAASIVDDFVGQISRFRPGALRLHLAGFSLGASIMLAYASRHPETVESLTMIGMPVILSKHLPFMAEAMTVTRPSFRASRADYGLLEMMPAFGPFRRGSFPMRLSNPDSAPWAYVEIARKIIADVDAAHLLPTVSFPALFVSGKNDYIGSQAQIDSLELPPQRIQIFGIPGETHFTSMLAPHMWKRVEMFLLQKNLD